MFAWQATVQDEAGNAVPLPVVTVYEADGETVASIYNEAGSGLPNPITGSLEGFVQFWLVGGQYKVSASSGGSETATWQIDLGGTDFPTRADFVEAVASGLSYADGTTVTAEGIGYAASGGYDGIPDAPGYAPVEAQVANYGVGSPAVMRMMMDVGYGEFRHPLTLDENLNIDGPIKFRPGAYISGSAGPTLNVRGPISADPWSYLFRGDYTLNLGHNPAFGNGENARDVHAGWFGAFPSSTAGIDVAPFINRGFAAIGNAREGSMKFQIGNYQMYSGTQVLRATAVVGKGTRRTVFKINGDGFIPFLATGEGCRFRGIQFEHSTQATTERASPYIRATGNNGDIEDVVAGRAFRSIEIAASGWTVRDVAGFYAVAGSPGSSLVAVKGANHIIENTQLAMAASVGPEHVVHIGAPLGGTVTATRAITVDVVQNGAPSVPVLIDGTDHNISSIIVSNLSSNPTPSTVAAVRVRSSNAYIVEGVVINGLQANANVGCAMELSTAGTSQIRDVILNGAMLLGSGSVIVTGTSGGSVSRVSISALNAPSRTKITGPDAGIQFLDVDMTGPYANDAAAATGGVAVGQPYRVTGGNVAYRQA